LSQRPDSGRQAGCIRDLILATTNDYGSIASAFRSSFGTSLIDPSLDEIAAADLRETVTVVIPSFDGQRTLPVVLAALERQRYRNFEVVVVDDGSDPPLRAAVDAADTSFAIEYRRIARSRGTSAARNVGIDCASGDTLVFLDDDIRVEPTVLGSIALRMSFTADCLFVGFRENVLFDRFAFDWDAHASIERDWRCHARDRGTYSCFTTRRVPPPATRRSYRLLEESDWFRSFGCGRVIGYWDLPQMVVGHSLAAKRSALTELGGFDEDRVTGWGTDDLIFGARMIAAGYYVVPALDFVSLHPAHEGRKVTRAQQMVELQANYERYLDYLAEPLEPAPEPAIAARA